jgi:hypothetical protein
MVRVTTNVRGRVILHWPQYSLELIIEEIDGGLCYTRHLDKDYWRYANQQEAMKDLVQCLRVFMATDTPAN